MMKTKLFGLALFAATLGVVTLYPSLQAKPQGHVPPTRPPMQVALQKPKVDVVFALDTTGSMSGLIETAKEKIWSIASTMASAQPTPDLRIGLVAFRDRGDQYVTRVVNLSDDLDSVYATLMEFHADGGGDTPESVNRALYDAIHGMSWSEAGQAYRVVFLVGDAPPHMDYNEPQYPEIVAAARDKGIVVNTIQCGGLAQTVEPWRAIAGLGSGEFLSVEQAGGALAMDTPFDAEIAALSAKLDATRLYYGSEEDKAQMSAKVAATNRLEESASVAARARRGVFNAAEGGRKNLTGENELVDAVAAGTVVLGEIEPTALPEALKPMAPAEQEEYVAQLAAERGQLQRQILDLADERRDYIARKVEEAGGAADSLESKLYDVVSKQAAGVGMALDSGPDY